MGQARKDSFQEGLRSREEEVQRYQDVDRERRCGQEGLEPQGLRGRQRAEAGGEGALRLPQVSRGSILSSSSSSSSSRSESTRFVHAFVVIHGAWITVCTTPFPAIKK